MLAIALGACRPDSTHPLPDTDSAAAPDPGSQSNASASDDHGPCAIGPSPLRRMTRLEYDRTVHDLLGDTTGPARAFPAEEEVLGFNNNADAQSLSPVLVEDYLEAAERLAEQSTTDVKSLTACDPKSQEDEDDCARTFIESFGRRAFRRPLVQQDRDDLLAAFVAGRKDGDFASGISLVIETALLSPEFLYRVEVDGTPAPDEPGVAKLDDYEVATRLSYFLWGSMPDETLFAAADAHQLSTPDEVAAQARRMVADPRARDVARTFTAQWLGLTRIDSLSKDPVVFPDFDPAIRPHLRAEADALVDDVLWDGPGDLKTLLTAKYTFVDDALARYYGMLGVRVLNGMQKVEPPGDRVSGLLSQAGVLAVHAHPDQTSPVMRGKFVREQFLCMTVPPPPEGVVVIPPAPDPNATTRERFAEHRNNPSCSGCHALMDPIGFGLERFDALGRYRDTENGQVIDDSGVLTGTAMGAFQGIEQLGAMLAEAPEVHECVARQWFRFAQGRAELAEDRCTVEQLTRQFEGSGLRIPDLMVAITTTRPFLYRSVEP